MPTHELLNGDLCLDDTEIRKQVRYSVEVLSLGLLYMEFSDLIREVLLEVLDASFNTKRRNDSTEALNVLAQYYFFFP